MRIIFELYHSDRLGYIRGLHRNGPAKVIWHSYKADTLEPRLLQKHYQLDAHSKLIGTKSKYLSHWGRMTHICAGNLAIIGSDNGLLPGRCQAITWTNAEIS